MFVDFGARPPEVNATLIYGGDGAATMLAAAAAWDGLAANLATMSKAFKTVVTGLVAESWAGPSATLMAAKLTTHAVWMDITAELAEESAIQAWAAASAYEGAFAMTVPPPVIAANRAQLAALVATNVLGVNTAAIMATEALYAEMWAQCAAAMYGYAGAASMATRLAPFPGPQHKPDPAARSVQDAAVSRAGANSGQGQVQQTVSGVLNQLTAPGETGGGNFFDNIWGAGDASGMGPNANIWNTITSTELLNPAMATSMLGHMAVLAEAADGDTEYFWDSTGIGPALSASQMLSVAGPGSAPAAPFAGSVAGGVAPVTASMGRASAIGVLSAPASWTATPAAAGGVLPEPSPVGSPQAGGPGAPGVPLAGLARGDSSSGPRYGIRPTVMARPPAAGYGPEAF
ncbi:PPE family protein [Mycolicibacillus trivialis]